MKKSVKRRGAVPIAIVGMAFRFPGDLSSDDDLWRALCAGRDLVSAIGPDRWATDRLLHPRRGEPGRSITFSAGVLSRIDEFDASFFGISPREAAWLDPQQRLLLELAWEAMENGGQVPSRLAGSDAAVFVGISGLDYGMRGLDDLAAMSSHSMTGNTLSIAANRLSYAFDLRGPSMAVDTACSSSLVALHQACGAIERGESSLALVGGVNLLLHPYPFVGFTKASMLSARGQCSAFDEAGDGYVRAEGAAVLLLKPLAQAQADGDPVEAVILASGVNSDGRRKSGITIPSGAGQAELMRSVLAKAGVAPGQVAYIEAHGTGTAVGDPIEARAIGEVYGRDRASPLPIGSVKTNLGHLEAASGMAGLVKTVLMLKHRALPPSLHLATPNPRIDFEGLNLRVVTRQARLERRSHPAPVMGVNSFGFGGANAHVLLRAARAPRLARVLAPAGPDAPLLLSARTHEALRALAGRYAAFLAAPGAPAYAEVVQAAALRREHLPKRLALVASEAGEAAALLERFAAGELPPALVLEDALAQPGSIAFVYSGNGAQWAGMGRQLVAEVPRIAELVAEVDAVLAPRSGFAVLPALREGASAERLADTAFAQPVLFAVQVALTRWLREQGLAPEAVMGHSVGEVAAAWAAGALDLAQAVEVVLVRSRAQALTRGTGRMAAVALPEEAMRALLAESGGAGLEIAAVNSPGGVTLAGPLAELDPLLRLLEARGVFCRLLELDYAFHTRAMDPVEARVLGPLDALAPRAADTAFVSSVSGQALEGGALGARYWWDNVRKPVRFAEAMRTLLARGCRLFVEIGPHAVLQRNMSECLSAAGVAGRVLPTLRRDDEGAGRLAQAQMRLRLAGAVPCLSGLFPRGPAPAAVRLPNYPWQRERFWHPRTSEALASIERALVHPLLGWRVPDCEATWENAIDCASLPYLADHRVGGAIVLPAAAYAEMALAAGREWFGRARLEVEDLDILAPIVLDGDHARSVRFVYAPRESTFTILSRPRLAEEPWTPHAVGRLLGDCAPLAPAAGATPDAGAALAIEASEHYGLAAAVGLDYGPAFRLLAGAHIAGGTIEGSLGAERAPQVESAYLLHPARLDACFQSLVNFFRDEIEGGKGVPLLPVKIGRLRHAGGGAASAFRVQLTHRGARSVQADIALLDASGATVALLERCRFRAATLQRRASAEPARWRVEACPLPDPDRRPAPAGPPTHALAVQVRARLADLEPVLRRRQYLHSGVPLFDALVVSFAFAAFRVLDESHGPWLQQVLADPEAMAPQRRPYFRWLVRCLGEAGLLEATGGAWRLDHDGAPPPADEIWRTVLAEVPDALPELLFVGRVGRRLEALLRGEEDAAALLEAIRQSHHQEPLFDDAPAYRAMNVALRELVQGLHGGWPADRPLRILEISGGSGELTRQLVPTAPADNVEYVVACADPARLARLQAEFEAHPVVGVAALEAKELKLEAAFPLPAAYDLVIVPHWLHRAQDLAATLAGLRRTLAPGGLLAVAERHPDLSADFVFGLDPAWWQQAQGREGSSLLSAGTWEALLADQGFADIESVREQGEAAFSGGVFLLVARNPLAPAAVAEPAKAAWLLVGEAGGKDSLAERLALLLRSQGQGASVACLPPGEMAPLLEAAREEAGGLDHVVLLATPKAGTEPMPPDLRATGHLLEAANRLACALGAQAPRPARLWLVTSGGALVAQPASDWPIDPAQAAFWGLGRVVMNEYPALACTLVDLAFDPHAPFAAERLASALLAPGGENEIVLEPHARYGLRLRKAPARAAPVASAAYRLDFAAPGQLKNLAWRPLAPRALAPDEIEVRPAFAGLNFRDVMFAMGLLPDEAVESGFAGATLGLEFAGTVTRVGSAVGDLRAGEEVMGFGPACFASHVVTRAGALARKPAAWSFAQAATVPTAFFTAYYALKVLAAVQPGERVLVHGAAGGVGIAAVQVAAHLGARVIATAGSAEKRDFVRLIGVEHVLDSRSAGFADEVLALTGGEGVDVVLNSLAGEAINRNLRALRPFGRFLELGKRDYVENTHIGLRPFKDNISYFGIDADQLLVARPQLAARLFQEVMALLREEVLTPLPSRAFPAARVVEAFRHMQQSRHIGKVLVDFTGAEAGLLPDAAGVPGVRFDREAAYVVTGGLTGFGLESACWLAERGAGHLVLLGRRGPDTPGAAEAIARLEALGASVRVFACDVADREALAAVFARLDRELPRLGGVLHAAMVLDDSLLARLDPSRWQRVLAPKIQGAWNLHELTLQRSLDHFILYSSVTTALGSPGQANYVAGNAFLESLAAWRRARGLPGTCVAWGPIGDAGTLARDTALRRELLARLGGEALASRTALAVLGEALARDHGPFAVADLGWGALSRILPSAQGSRFHALRRAGAAGEAGEAAAGDWRAALAGKTPDEARRLVQALVTAEVAQILSIGQERLDPTRSLYDLGMDSLMAVELAMGIEKRFEVRLPAMVLGEGPSIERVSARLADMLLGAPAAPEEADTLASLVNRMDAQHGAGFTADELAETVEQIKRRSHG